MIASASASGLLFSLWVTLSNSEWFAAALAPGCASEGALGLDFRSVPLFWAGLLLPRFSKLAAYWRLTDHLKVGVLLLPLAVLLSSRRLFVGLVAF